MPLALKLEFQFLPMEPFPINDHGVRVTHIGCVHTVLIGVVHPLPKGATVAKKLWQQDLAGWLRVTRNMGEACDFACQALVGGNCRDEFSLGAMESLCQIIIFHPIGGLSVHLQSKLPIRV